VLCDCVQVAGLSLDGVAPFQAASLIAGPDDSSISTPVSLIVRKADGQVVDLTVQRPARFLSTPVSSSLQQRYSGERIGVIRLTSFNARALRDVSAALDQLQQQGATEIVLDLRDNRCVGVVGMLLWRGRTLWSGFDCDTKGAAPPSAGRTQLSQVTPTAEGRRPSLTDEGHIGWGGWALWMWLGWVWLKATAAAGATGAITWQMAWCVGLHNGAL
jgi:hypothetical protein